MRPGTAYRQKVGYGWPPGCSAAWLARLLWEQEVAGSNPAIPTIFRICYRLLEAILVASICRRTSAVVAQRLRKLASISPLN
jgi:hypothetical protein